MKTTIFLSSLVVILSCQKDNTRTIDTTYNPDISPSKFASSTLVNNKYFGLEAGKTYFYEGQSANGKERDETKRLATKKTVAGIPCIIIEDKAFLNDKLIELTYDWYAQDKEGNVWYFGEKVDNYDSNGKLLNHNGSWEAGVDGAKAGMIMLANPQVGIKYRQEYYFNEAEDQAEILSINESISIPIFNTLANGLKTKEFTELEPQALEHKFYAPGLGLVKITNFKDKYDTFLTRIN